MNSSRFFIWRVLPFWTIQGLHAIAGVTLRLHNANAGST
jgi:hypothetical protein